MRGKRSLGGWLPGVWALVALAVGGTVDAAEPLPQRAAPAHMGVATCASGVCHGRTSRVRDGDILGNAYVTWTRRDPHSNAYDTLRSEASRRIAGKLGLDNAHEADVCLDCHADNVATQRRGEAFRLTDGVGCEACHGGAENWLDSHANDSATHADNLAEGMYPTADAGDRGRLCVSCHLGTPRKFATHRIMGAGHPRLAFELDTFTALEPPHWVVDADYRQRKPAPDTFTTWARGLIVAARQTLELVQSPRLAGDGAFPELALFDCHACHHRMSQQRWQPQRLTGPLPPGSVRLNDADLLLLLPISEVLAPALHERLLERIRTWHRSVKRGREAMRTASAEVMASLDALAARLEEREPTRGELSAVLKQLLALGVRGEYRDYAAAEQATMAVDLLLITTERAAAHADTVDRLYTSVADDERFEPASFVEVLETLDRELAL